MNIDHNDTFQRMIDESLAGVLSAEKEQSLREHLSTCATCREYLSASNRVIAGLSGFSFEVNPTLNARVLTALRLQAEEGRGILARDTGDNATAQRAIQELGCICCSTLDVICRIGTRVPDGRAPGGPNAFCLCSSTGRRARLSGCCHLFARPYVCSRRLVRIEVLHDTAIGGAFGSVFGRNCSCGCLIENGNAEDSTPICNGHRGTGDPDLGALFCFRPGPFPTCYQRISQCDARSALVWLDVWRLHRGFFPCPRIYLRGRKKASKACLGLGDCRFPHTQFHWIHSLFSVPRASPWALQLLWQAYSRGRSILQPLRMLAGFQYRTHHS